MKEKHYFSNSCGRADIDKLRKEEKERNKERIVYMAGPYFNCDAAADQYKIKF